MSKLAYLNWPVPDYTRPCRRHKVLPIMLGSRPRPVGLHLLVDSIGIKVVSEGERKVRKHKAYRRQWLKVPNRLTRHPVRYQAPTCSRTKVELMLGFLTA